MTIINLTTEFNLSHVESMTLNGVSYDGSSKAISWVEGGTKLVITFKPDVVVVGDFPNFRYYDNEIHTFRNQASLDGNVYTADFKYPSFYTSRGRAANVLIETTGPAVAKTFTLNPVLELDHIESMTLNGDEWDGLSVDLEWDGVGNIIVITYKPDATIEDWPNFRWYDKTSHYWVTQGKASGNVHTVNFKVEEYYDGTVRDLTITSFMETVEVSSPFNRLYLMDREKMTALSNVMPVLYPNGPPDSGHDAKDNSGYILNMLLMPFKIPTDVVGNSISIKIGDNDTGVVAPMVIDDSIDVDLGNITISDSNSVTDFVGVEYELHLPFSSRILKLDASDVVGKPISVKYNLDAYSGDISINVFNGGQYPFASETDRVGRGIPFRLFNDPTNGMDKMISLNNGLLSAYIKETRVELADGMYNNLILVDGVLGDSTGYVEVENCDLRGVPETAKVLSLLKGGVVIR